MTAAVRAPAREERQASLLLAVPYMGLMAASVLYPYFTIVRLPWFTMHLAYAAIIGLTLMWVFVTGEFARVRKALVFLLLFSGPYLIMLAQSMAIWIAEQDAMSLIKRGGATIAYQLLGIAAVAGAYVLFGQKAVLYTFLGMIGGNALLLLSAVAKIGAGDFIRQLLAFYMSIGGEDNAASRAMEVHDLTFAFGLFVIYYWLFAKGKPGRVWCLLIACAFFLLGWKRIAIPGILLAGAYVWWMRRLPEPRAKAWTMRFGLALVAFSFANLLVIRTGLYAQICNALGIDTMGRIELLRFIERYYTLDPLYMGYGIGFITRMMQDFIESGRAVLNAAMSIHNDILARYIELGFLGFTVWAVYLFYLTPRFIASRWSREAATAFFAAMLYCFLTYLTDNTAGYFHINFCLRLFPLALGTGAAAAKERT